MAGRFAPLTQAYLNKALHTLLSRAALYTNPSHIVLELVPLQLLLQKEYLFACSRA